MKYAIIGTGAVGGYYGGLLAHHGFDVHFLLRSDYEHVKKNGLSVESVNGDFTLSNVNAYCHPEDLPLCDVVIIALKTTQNNLLADIIPQVTKKNGIIIVLQNGLGVEKDVSNIFPEAVVLGGLCFLCSNKVGPGHIRHLDFGAVNLAEYAPDGGPAGITANLKKISDEFSQAGIHVKLSENLGKARWEKLVWNIPFNGLSVILNTSTDSLMMCKASRFLIKEIMIEVISGAEKCGYPVNKEFADIMLETTGQMAVYKTSMMIDYEKGNPLEIEKIYRVPISDAESAGYLMPRVKTIAYQLEYLQQTANLQS